MRKLARDVLNSLEAITDDTAIGYGWREQNGPKNQTLCFTEVMKAKELALLADYVANYLVIE